MDLSRRDVVAAWAFIKATTTRIGALQVWQKQDGAWKLIARQGFRLPA